MVTSLVSEATQALARFAPYDPLPTCSTTVFENCIALNQGGSTVTTNSVTYTYKNVDTPVSQRVDQYQTTIAAILNASQTVFQETFPLPYSDPTVQAAVQQADAILTQDQAMFGSPNLISNSSTLQSSQLSYVQTGPPTPDPGSPPVVSTVDSFGPETILVGDNLSQVFNIHPGQLDINVNTAVTYDVPRNAVTTNTFLTTQVYDINGTSGVPVSVPEPSSWLLACTGLIGLVVRRVRRS